MNATFGAQQAVCMAISVITSILKGARALIKNHGTNDQIEMVNKNKKQI